MTPYLPLPLFVLLYAAATFAWGLTPLAGAAYLAMSLACFVAYALPPWVSTWQPASAGTQSFACTKSATSRVKRCGASR
jgi:hypothetical protein